MVKIKKNLGLTKTVNLPDKNIADLRDVISWITLSENVQLWPMMKRIIRKLWMQSIKFTVKQKFRWFKKCLKR